MDKVKPGLMPDAYAASFDGWRGEELRRLRAAALAVEGVDEIMKWGHLVYLSDGPVALIRVEGKRVLFGLWRGQRLLEAEPRLKPGGQFEMASISLSEGETLDAAVVTALVRSGVALNAQLGDPTKVAKVRLGDIAMRKLRLSTFLTLDGVMQAPGGPTEDWTNDFRYGGWLAPHADETVGEMMGEWIGSDYDLLLGGKTYEIFAAHWPDQDDEVGRTFNAIDKFVVAGPETPLTWANSHRLQGDPAEAVQQLKVSGDRDLLIQGSGQLVQALLAADLIDEMSLMVFPVLLGQGKRLFREGALAGSWRLERVRHSPSGAVFSRYVRAGPVETAAIATAADNDRERARQERMRREG